MSMRCRKFAEWETGEENKPSESYYSSQRKHAERDLNPWFGLDPCF